MRVSSRVVKQRKTEELRNNQEFRKTCLNHKLVSSLPAKTKTKICSILAKNSSKTEIKLFP